MESPTPFSTTVLVNVGTPSASKGTDAKPSFKSGSSMIVTHSAATRSPSRSFRRDRPLRAFSAENTPAKVLRSVLAASLRSTTR